MQTDEITSTAHLLLELYGKDVLFGTPEQIDRFLVDTDLLDKSFWRQVLLAAEDLVQAIDRRLYH